MKEDYTFEYTIRRPGALPMRNIFTLKEIEHGSALKWITENDAREKDVSKKLIIE